MGGTAWRRIFRVAAGAAALAVMPAAAGQTAGTGANPAETCADGDAALNVGFYAFFAPVSHSAESDPASPGFGIHEGYEAALLTALEAIPGAGLKFSRAPIAEWDGIWLRPAAADGPDMVGGGITILDGRTRDASGKRAIRFTSGHIAFRQSLLVRAEDAARLATYGALKNDARVGVLAGTTGEARLLRIAGIADDRGALAAGTRVVTPAGEVTADGGPGYVITAAEASTALAGRRLLHPASPSAPQVVYLGDYKGEAELLAALGDGRIDALARGEIGNRSAAAGNPAFAVSALDDEIEWGGFALAFEDADLASCIDRHVDYLTDDRRIGYAEWLADPAVFMKRATGR